jgi:hypothetical protein
MRFNSLDLLQELQKITQNNREFVVSLKAFPEEILTTRLDVASWNILECIEHLNYYGNFYLPEIENRMHHGQQAKKDYFQSGLLGNYFAQSMLPKEKLNKMKTFKSVNPIYNPLDIAVLDNFIEQQDKMLELLEVAKTKDLTVIKTNISISRFIKLRLGDTFRIVIYHNLRHIEQARNILKAKGVLL